MNTLSTRALSARILIAGIMAASGAVSKAQNTLPVVTPTPSDAGTVTITGGGSSGWIISILATKSSGASELEFAIVGDATTQIERVSIQRQREVTFTGACDDPTETYGLPVRISVSDGVAGPGVGSVMQIERSFTLATVGCGGNFFPPLCPCPDAPIFPLLVEPAWYVDITQLDVAGDLGDVAMQDPSISGIRKIVSAVIEGDVLSPIELDMTDEGTEVVSLEIQGNLEASISSVLIGDLEVSGRLGQGETKEHIVVVHSLGGIERLLAGSISATIESGTLSDPAPIGLLQTTGDASSNADVSGTIWASEIESATVLNPGIFVLGSFRGELELTEPLVNPLWIDGALSSTGLIQLPSQGLRSQIIINRAAGSATWSGKVVLGEDPTDIELDSASYAALPSAIGDGAAGRAPFTMHAGTASPPNYHYAFISGIDIMDPMMGCYDIPFTSEISFQLYGPASIESGTGTPAKVQVRTGPSTWTDAFDISAEIVSGTDSRGLKFVRKDGSGNPIAWPLTLGEYRIVPKADRILCVDVAGEPTVAFEYYIELADGCGLMLLQGFDLNSDETLCSEDIAEWVSNPVDLNGDEIADSEDCALLISAVSVYSSR